MGVLLTSAEYTALLKRIEKLEECCDRLSNPEPEPDKHYLEKNPHLTDLEAWVWCLNNEPLNILKGGRKAYYRGVGKKSIKVEALKQTQWVDEFTTFILRSEVRIVDKIIELRAIEPFKII